MSKEAVTISVIRPFTLGADNGGKYQMRQTHIAHEKAEKNPP